MVTTELRRDPITGRSVLIDVRSQPPHPSDFLIEPVSVAGCATMASAPQAT